MFARPRVIFAVRDKAVLVPEEALVPLGGKQLLFKVVDGADGQKVSQRLEARIGLRVPGKVEILEGVKPGDAVVTAGHARMLRCDKLPERAIDLAAVGTPAARGPGAAASGSATSGYGDCSTT